MVADVMESTIGCKDMCRIVEEYLAGRLDANTQKAIDDHLVTCQACQDEVDIALEIFSVLQELPKQQPPPEVFANVLSYVQSHPKRTSPVWFDWIKRVLAPLYSRPLSTAAASICLIGLVLFGTYQRHQSSIRIEKASHELNYALKAMSYIVRKTEGAVGGNFPTGLVTNTPRQALVNTVGTVRRAATKGISYTVNDIVSVEPVNQVKDLPQEVLTQAATEINLATSKYVSRAIGGSFGFLNRFTNQVTNTDTTQ